MSALGPSKLLGPFFFWCQVFTKIKADCSPKSGYSCLKLAAMKEWFLLKLLN